jgi:MFS transporter, FHS family, L-fucose permease
MSAVEKNIELNALAARVIFPYSVIIVCLLVLAGIIWFSNLPEIEAKSSYQDPGHANGKNLSIFLFRHLLLGVLAMFLYIGVEVISGDTIISYAHAQGIGLSTAKYFATCTLIFMIIGYCFGIITIPKYLSQQAALTACAILGIILSAGALLTSGALSVLLISSLGLANSLMFPSIFPLAINGLGKFTKLGSSFLVMAIAGGAVIPLIYGRLADKITSHYAYLITIPCYLFILFFAQKGYKFKRGI